MKKFLSWMFVSGVVAASVYVIITTLQNEASDQQEVPRENEVPETEEVEQ